MTMLSVLEPTIADESTNEGSYHVYLNRASRDHMRVRGGNMYKMVLLHNLTKIPISLNVNAHQTRSGYRNVEGVIFGSTLNQELERYFNEFSTFWQLRENMKAMAVYYCDRSVRLRVLSNEIILPNSALDAMSQAVQNGNYNGNVSKKLMAQYMIENNIAPAKLVIDDDFYHMPFSFPEFRDTLHAQMEVL